MRSDGPLDQAQLRGLSAPWALVGARIWTGEPSPRGSAEAIAFDAHGGVLACGQAPAVRAQLPRGADVVDARGAFVCPGFVDPHVHVRAAASAELAIDASAAGDSAGLLAAVTRARHSHSGWISVVGAAIDSPLRSGAPDRRALDRAGRGAPVRIRSEGGHGWLMSSAALRRLRVTIVAAGQRDLSPAGVTIERDHAGVATGFVADHVGWVTTRLGRISSEQRQLEAVRSWSTAAARLGIVAICDATATNGQREASALLRWREAGSLRQEITFLSAPDATIDHSLRRHHAGVKFARAEDPRLVPALERAAARGLRIAVHCIEPSETAAALTAAMKVPAYARGALRVEHATFVPPDWIGDVARARASIVTHPALIDERGDRYLGDPLLEPSEWLYRLRSWVDAGVPVAFASDAPFGPIDPLRGLRAAASRATRAGRRIGSRESLTGERALAAVTSAAAKVAGLDRLGFGRLRRGGPGAAAILSGDPRDPAALRELELIATVIGGRVVD